MPQRYVALAYTTTVYPTSLLLNSLVDSSSVDRWTQVVDLYVQSVVYHSEYRTIKKVSHSHESSLNHIKTLR